ncbi:MAG TPA: hypothetical protein H9700_09750 [Candidatus Eisenbergiella intestinipullorum]|nr:hypothetical protein [Candidatus Eisenbergiella intestinipullorum]
MILEKGYWLFAVFRAGGGVFSLREEEWGGGAYMMMEVGGWLSKIPERYIKTYLYKPDI